MGFNLDNPHDNETKKGLLLNSRSQKDGTPSIFKIENSDVVFHLDIKQNGITCIVYDLSLSGSFFKKHKE